MAVNRVMGRFAALALGVCAVFVAPPRPAAAAEPAGLEFYKTYAETLQELETVDRPALASLAVKFPSARLIDCQPLDDQVLGGPNRPA